MFFWGQQTPSPAFSRDEEHRRLVNESIKGDFTLKKVLSLRTTNGSITTDVDIASYPKDTPRSLYTSAVNGSVRVSFHSPLGDISRCLQSTHESTTGSVNIFYPDDWQGTIEAKNWVGPCEILGKDVTILRSEKSMIGKLTMVAVKGCGFEAYDSSYSLMKVSSSTGKVSVVFEDEEAMNMRQRGNEGVGEGEEGEGVAAISSPGATGSKSISVTTSDDKQAKAVRYAKMKDEPVPVANIEADEDDATSSLVSDGMRRDERSPPSYDEATSANTRPNVG